MRHVFLKRASIFGALFFCAGLIQADSCSDPGNIIFHPVKQVHDGDSVTLTNGHKVRLVGINTPEIGRDGRPDKPLAQEAKQYLLSQLQKTDYRIGLLADKQNKDKYGRLLRHAFLAKGKNLTADMLAKGLGWHVIISPNTAFIDCYAQAQEDARNRHSGVWRHTDILSTKNYSNKNTGFRLIRGRITRVGHSKQAVWLNFSNDFTIRIKRRNLRYFPGTLEDLVGKTVEASGWVYLHRRKGKKEPRMEIYHPKAINVIE